MKNLFLKIAIVLLILYALLSGGGQEPTSQKPEVATISAQVRPQTINSYRVGNGLHVLTHSEALQKSADARAKNIKMGLSEWSHDGYQEHVSTYYRYSKIGENLARNFDNIEDVFLAWHNSPTHQEVMLVDWCEYGLGQHGDVYVLHVGCPL